MKVREGLCFFAIIVPNRPMMTENLLESSRIYFSLHTRVKHSSLEHSGLVKKGVLSHQTSTKFVRVVTFFVPVDEPICVLSPPSANHVQVVARWPRRIIITLVLNTIVTRSLSDIVLRSNTLPSTTTMAESKKKAPATHPSCIDMIVAAIGNLKEKNGSSTQAIKKYIAANYNVDMEKLATHIRKALVTGVEKGKLVQTKGKGAAGSFKLNASAQKADAKKAKEAAKKKAQKEKEAAKKKAQKEKAAAKKKAQKEKAKKKKPAGDKKKKASTKKADKPKKKATKKTPTKAKKAKPAKKTSDKKKATKKSTPKKKTVTKKAKK